MLDTEAQVPLYKQLKEIIKNKIKAGEYRKNSRIPTEPELTEKYGISRITVRKAIEELVDEGYLTKRQGKGTFVKQRKVFRKIDYVTGFTNSCQTNGLTPSSEVLRVATIPATTELATKLQIEPKADVLHIKRKRLADGVPLLLENNYFPKDRFGFLVTNDLQSSLYQILAEHGVKAVDPSETTLEIVTADDKLAETMSVSIGTPFFYVNTVINDQNRQPIHVGQQYYLGDVYKFSL